MPNTIRIKRTTSSSRPTSLANAEVAFIEGSQILVYGTGTGGAGGTATSIIDIGGAGAFLGLGSGLTQTAAGTYTFSGTVTFSGTTSLGGATATTQTTSDNSTKVATTAFVKAQGYLTSSTAVTSVALSLPAIFTVSGSPVTTTGTLSATLASQTAATVFAAPAGASGAPTFRALVAGDIPTLTAAKISDFTSSVTAVRLDQHAAPTADVSFNSQKITNLAAPVSDTDAANKAYVDAARSGLDVKASVRAATTANITLSNTQTIDGVVLVAGDRVLVKDQTTGSQNGIYAVVSGGAWTRATDADISAEVTPGMFTFVEEGTANADSGWVLSTNSTITLGTTALAFVQFSGAGQLTAGDGLTKTGSQIDVVTASSTRIVVSADSIDLATTGVTAGTYKSVTVDTYGRVTAGTSPTTLSGYGITDAQSQIASVGLLKGAGSGSVSAAVAGTDYQAAISATGLLKGAGGGSVSAAVAGTDYLSPSSDIDGGTY